MCIKYMNESIRMKQRKKQLLVELAELCWRLALPVQGLPGVNRVIWSLFINNGFELEQGSEEMVENLFWGLLEGFLE